MTYTVDTTANEMRFPANAHPEEVYPAWLNHAHMRAVVGEQDVTELLHRVPPHACLRLAHTQTPPAR